MGETDIPVRDAFQVHVVYTVLDELLSSVGKVFVFRPLAKGFIELSFNGRDLRSGAVWWDGGGGAGKPRVGEGWRVNGCGSGVFCWGEDGAQVAVCTPAKGAGYRGEVAFQRRFDVVEYFVVGSSSTFYDFVGKCVEEVVDLVDGGRHGCCCVDCWRSGLSKKKRVVKRN